MFVSGWTRLKIVHVAAGDYVLRGGNPGTGLQRMFRPSILQVLMDGQIVGYDSPEGLSGLGPLRIP